MKRLTDNKFHTREEKERAIYVEESRLQAIYDKLFDLEDIEEEFGIDLTILFKAFKNGCWIRKGSYGHCYLEGEPVFIPSCELFFNLFGYYSESKNINSDDSTEDKEAFCLFNMEWEYIDNIARVKDYGKTWALTKEELL